MANSEPYAILKTENILVTSNARLDNMPQGPFKPKCMMGHRCLSWDRAIFIFKILWKKWMRNKKENIDW